jgi:hypothetical protein
VTQQIQPPQLQQPIGQLRQAGPSNHHEGRDSHGLVSEVFATLAFNKLLQDVVVATQGTDPASGVISLGPVLIFYGSGSPVGVVVAAPGALYINLSGGANLTLWVKEANSDATGWTAK